MGNVSTIPGVTVSLDETGDMPRVVVTFPKGLTLPKPFVRQCHTLAGEHGATVEFKGS
jgi:hypothetical protein